MFKLSYNMRQITEIHGNRFKSQCKDGTPRAAVRDAESGVNYILNRNIGKKCIILFGIGKTKVQTTMFLYSRCSFASQTTNNQSHKMCRLWGPVRLLSCQPKLNL